MEDTVIDLLGLSLMVAIGTSIGAWVILFGVSVFERWGGLRKPLRTVGAISRQGEFVSAWQHLVGTAVFCLAFASWHRDFLEPWVDTLTIAGKMVLIIFGLYAVVFALLSIVRRKRE